MRTYNVLINGSPATLQLPDEVAQGWGLLASESVEHSEPKKANRRSVAAAEAFRKGGD